MRLDERSYRLEAKYHSKQNRENESIRVLQKAYEIPDIISPDCTIKLAQILHRRGDYKKCAELLAKCVKYVAQIELNIDMEELYMYSALSAIAIYFGDRDEFNPEDVERLAKSVKEGYRFVLKTNPKYTRTFRSFEQLVDIFADSTGYPIID